MPIVKRYIILIVVTVVGAMGLRIALDTEWGVAKKVPSNLTETDLAIESIPLEWQGSTSPEKVTRLKEWRGKVLVLFFGYQQCPDICPTSLGYIARELKTLGEDRSKIQTIFVSVDPSHDNAAGLATYTQTFDPTFIGVTGTDAALRNMTDKIGVYFQEVTPNTNMAGQHLERLAHSATLFIIDEYGHLSDTLSPPLEPGALASMLDKVLKGKAAAH